MGDIPPTYSPGQSSTEDYEEDSGMMESGGQWEMQQSHGHGEQASPSIGSSGASSSQPSKIPLPMQKRRRVTRACDECRRKKIKCDGKQPCTHCTVYSYECTYDQPSNRRRNPAPQYIEALENRLQRAEALLKTVLPDVDLGNPNFDAGVPQRMHAPVRQNVNSTDPARAQTGSSSDKDKGGESLLESMVESTGQLDLDDQGCWDFHGHSSGLAFLRRMREQFGDIMGPEARNASPFLKTRPMSQVFDSPKSADSPVDSILADKVELPPIESAIDLCHNALDHACALMRFVHQPTFYSSLHRIYGIPREDYGNEDNKFLPLLYVVLAVGCLFTKIEQIDHQQSGYESAIDHGFKYFKESRLMTEITDCRDLTSLQAVVFMIFFLQSSARLSTCYSYIGIALRSSLRMGLHRSVSANFNPIERETRKRVFWVVRKMDIYVGALLGLPKTLSDEDIDQEYPMEIDDEYITKDQILPMSSGKFPLIAASNAHTKLLRVLAKVIKYIYPIKGQERSVNGKSDQSYMVSHAKIREIEQDLQEWMENLPMPLRPGSDQSPDIARVQQLLRMAYAHVQMILYRPFLHYVSQSYQTKTVDKRSYACAAACVSVSRNIIHITAEMKRRGLLIGAYWFTMYTTFFAIMTLVFYTLENPDSSTSQDILRDAKEGKETLASLSSRSMAADRCTATLAVLFDKLPEKLKQQGRDTSTSAKKKRQAPLSNSAFIQSVQSLPGVGQNVKASEQIQRASTFPTHLTASPLKRASVPYDASSLRSNSNIDHYRRSSHIESLTPSEVSVRTPESGSNSNTSLPYIAAQQQQLSMQQHFGGSGLPDLSSMMFPSADPFAYPNQPITTLENKHFKQDPLQMFDANNPCANNNSMFIPSNSGGGPYDSLEVQLFGPLPPYLMQSQQPSMGMTSGPGGLAGITDDIFTQQSRQGGTSGMSLDEIFGGDEWNGFMDQNTRQ
ncbi:MAG: hypothetical protein M1827_001596 [Pycnora praestabilis]|nr:MAG: hypothetical protein M1827_001596 [Pycnora praestabilis]